MCWQCGNELSDISLFTLPFCFPLSVSAVDSILSFSQIFGLQTKHRHPSQLTRANLSLAGSAQTPGSADSSSFCPSLSPPQAGPARKLKRKQEKKKSKKRTDIKALPQLLLIQLEGCKFDWSPGSVPSAVRH